jgi:hypothetical protein
VISSIEHNNLITICGSGRNVGKTFLGENIISAFSHEYSIVAIKISKFKHTNHQNDYLKLLFKTSYYTIWQELSFSSKDSGRYLRAGAKLSIYIESDDSHLFEAFQFVTKKYCKNCLIICESASITKYIKPSLSVFIQSIDLNVPQNKIRSYKSSNLVLLSKSIEISLPKLFLKTENKQWVTKYFINCKLYNN